MADISRDAAPVATGDLGALPEAYQRLLALAQQRYSIEIGLLDELKGGRTGARLALVSVAETGSGEVRHLVLKLDRISQKARSDEIERHRLALSLAPPEFARQHMAELVYEVKDREHIALFYAIAGQSLLQFRPLAHFAQQSQLEAIWRATHECLLERWNAEAAFERAVLPQKLLERWLGYRLGPEGNIAGFLENTCHVRSDTGGFLILGEAYPNPLAFGRDPSLWGSTRPVDVLTGFQHGDLNIRNILVRFAPNQRYLDGYFLIDFVLFKAGMPLLYDQHYLAMSHLVSHLEQMPLEPWAGLVTHYAGEDLPDPQQVPVGLAGACAVLNAGREAFKQWVESSYASLSDDLWAQFWLAGVAAGLNYCNKRACPDRERLAGLIYAAAHLKRYCTQFGIGSPAQVQQLFAAGQGDVAAVGERPAQLPQVGYEVSAQVPLRQVSLQESLPEHATPFVGRQREITEIGELLAAHRLVTLSGPGGIGKTRLAVAAAEARRGSYQYGAHFVPLLAHDTPSAIVPAIAEALGLSFREGRAPQDQLLEALNHTELLLVLDNLEHLLGKEKAGATLALVEALLEAVPGLTLLVTSRELLRLPQEQAYLVEGLPVGADGAQAEASDESAVQLFRLRAQRGQTAGTLRSEEDVQQVRQLCRAVAGMPLAIELAAAQLRLLSLAEITARIQSDLDILDAGLRGAAARHQSMRVAFEASWDSLEVGERLVFARLSVFQGGFTLDAAGQVAHATLRELAGLVDKSLISRTADGRFALHALIQMFAAQKLAALPDELAQAHERHHRYYRDLATAAASQWEHERNLTALDALRPEVDNLRAGWKWTLDRRDWVACSTYMDALWSFYRSQGRLTEAMELLEEALAAGTAGEPHADAVCQAHWERLLGQGHEWLSELELGDKHFRRALAALGWPIPESEARVQLDIAGQLVVQALHRLGPALAIGRGADRQAAIGEALIAYENLAQRAFIYNETALGLFCCLRELNLAEASGLPWWMARAYAGAAYMFLLAPLRGIAAFYMRKSLALTGPEPPDEVRTWVSSVAGHYYFSLGDLEQARVHFELTADAAGRLDQTWVQENGWVGLIMVSYFCGDYQRTMDYALMIDESADRRGDIGFKAAVDYWKGVVKLQQGHLEEALADLQRSVAAPDEVMNPFDWMIVWTAAARTYLHLGRLDRATAEADKFQRMIDENPSFANDMFIYGFAGTAAVYLAAWEAEGAVGQRTALQARAQKACRNLRRAARIFVYGQAAAQLYQGCYAWLDGRPRDAYAAWWESLARAEAAGLPYEEGLAHYEIGRHLPEGESSEDGWGREEHLQRAVEIFSRLGVPYDLARARTALSQDAQAL